MKKILLSAALASVMGVAAVAPQAAKAYDGQIQFKGNVKGQTCTVTAGGGASGDSSNITVQLKTVLKSALAKNGDAAGEMPFTLTVGGPGETDCAASVASVAFDPANVNSEGRLNNLSGNSPATNVDIELVNGGTGQAIHLLNGANMPSANFANNVAVLNLIARYHATGASTQGEVVSTANYSVTYN